MKRNIGSYDRIIRIIIGLVLIGLSFMNVIGWWGWIGVIPIVTALIGWCPLYTPMGINTFDQNQCSLKSCKKKP